MKCYSGTNVRLIGSDGSEKIIERNVINEQEVSIYVNEQKCIDDVCTLSCIRELAVGRLFCDEIIASKESIIDISVQNEGLGYEKVVVNVTIDSTRFEKRNSFDSVREKMEFFCEDISRRGVLDKLIGYIILNGLDVLELVIYITGRISFDMVKKLILCGVKVLVTKSVPTDRAIELAHKGGIQLICRAWPDSIEIY